MGCSLGVLCVTTFCACHEETSLLKNFPHLSFHCRYVDDQFRIWEDAKDEKGTNNFEKEAQNFGGSKWHSEPFSYSADFLALTIALSKGTVTTKTYQKPMNLCLCIPPHSAHQPGTVKSQVFAQLQQHW